VKEKAETGGLVMEIKFKVEKRTNVTKKSGYEHVMYVILPGQAQFAMET
jgi:hypothetical protein